MRAKHQTTHKILYCIMFIGLEICYNNILIIYVFVNTSMSDVNEQLKKKSLEKSIKTFNLPTSDRIMFWFLNISTVNTHSVATFSSTSPPLITHNLESRSYYIHAQLFSLIDFNEV